MRIDFTPRHWPSVKFEDESMTNGSDIASTKAKKGNSEI